MYSQLKAFIDSVENVYLSALLKKLFVEDEEFIKAFEGHSAAKTVHHGFIGGLMEHTLGVTRLCDYMSKAYPVINRDLLITASLFHVISIGTFPQDRYCNLFSCFLCLQICIIGLHTLYFISINLADDITALNPGFHCR